jgi:hypothetical protein
MTMPFHVMPFEKRFFEKKNDFLLKYHQNPQVPKRRSIGKKEKKRKKKKKLQESHQIKGEVNILSGEK